VARVAIGVLYMAQEEVAPKDYGFHMIREQGILG
jgi:hypothetical protein